MTEDFRVPTRGRCPTCGTDIGLVCGPNMGPILKERFWEDENGEPHVVLQMVDHTHSWIIRWRTNKMGYGVWHENRTYTTYEADDRYQRTEAFIQLQLDEKWIP